MLLQDKSIEVYIDEHVTLGNLESNDSAIWTLLLMSGYITSDSQNQSQENYRVKIPNNEIKDLFRRLISRWLSGVEDPMVFNRFIDNLLVGNVIDFSENLQRLMLQTFSSHDIKGKKPEKFFHGFMLGLMSSIDQEQYIVQSNKESGYGRFDICIIPNDPTKLGIIIEVKSIAENDPKILHKAATEALSQIENQNYTVILSHHQIKRCLKIGVAFGGKDLMVEYSQTID